MKLTTKKIGLITIIQIIIISILYYAFFYKPNYNYTNNINNDDSPRNERSTPREFLLPATPAVTKIQALRNKKIKLANIINCLSLINEKGFLIYNLKDDKTANSIASIYAYQEENKLLKTGKLDLDTQLMLGCKINYD